MGLRESLSPKSVDLDLICFQFDQACWYLQSYIQGELDAVPLGKGKNAEKNQQKAQERLLNRLLGITTDKSPGQFRDPGMML